MKAGRESDYHGPAVHPRHLSLWERHVLKIGRYYDPAADLEQRREAQLAELSQAAESGRLKHSSQAVSGHSINGASAEEVAHSLKHSHQTQRIDCTCICTCQGNNSSAVRAPAIEKV